MTKYSDEEIKEIECNYRLRHSQKAQMYSKLGKLCNLLKGQKAKNYLGYGVIRRIKILVRCIDNIFSLFPLNQTEILDDDVLDDVTINLHAFCINVAGILDNLAWVYVSEKELNLSGTNVGLFAEQTKKKFSNEFQAYLNSEPIKKWKEDYIKNYRDALCHRISLYIPPKTIIKKSGEEVPCILMQHSLDNKNPIYFHVQIITDLMTIEEIINKFYDQF